MSYMKPDIDHSHLITLLHYDPATGIFTQKLRWWNRNPGDTLGTKTPQGYWYVCVGGKQYPAHRLAWFYVHGEWPEGDIDHINRNRLDNRIENLRVTTRSRNLHNSSGRSKSGHKGVRSTKYGTFEAVIMVDKTSYYLGSYKTIDDAAAARLFAERLFFGQPLS